VQHAQAEQTAQRNRLSNIKQIQWASYTDITNLATKFRKCNIEDVTACFLKLYRSSIYFYVSNSFNYEPQEHTSLFVSLYPSSVIAKGPQDVLCQLKCCQSLHSCMNWHWHWAAKVKVLHPTQHKKGHFGDVLPRQSLGLDTT